MDLKDSRTRENLMRAFAGESQARNRYTFAAELAEENGLYVLKEIFEMTAHQELEHAQVFYHFLDELNGENIEIQAGYPVNTSENVLEQIKAAVRNEAEEAESIYPKFGEEALKEGFNKVE